jgi:hypothetical protein
MNKIEWFARARYGRGAVMYGDVLWPSFSVWMVPGCEAWG